MDYTPTWIELFPNGERRIPKDEHLGFNKKSEGFHMGGCYLFAFDESREIESRTPNHLDEKVRYIGTAGSSEQRGIISRTQDFTTTILKGRQLKNPYANGMQFRIQEGVEKREYLYASYIPMGFGPEVKIQAHNKETQLLEEYEEHYGKLPSWNCKLSMVGLMLDMYGQLSESQKQVFCEKVQIRC